MTRRLDKIKKFCGVSGPDRECTIPYEELSYLISRLEAAEKLANAFERIKFVIIPHEAIGPSGSSILRTGIEEALSEWESGK